jgi:two-component system response regulator VicR
MRPKPPEGVEKYRILVVEDDMHIGRLVTANLTRAGFECRHAPDGVFGLEAFRETDPHLVILDVMMPRMDGREVCGKIRETSTVPIIMLTAMNTEEDQVRGLKMGADDYVPKPFNPKLLIARVVSWLRRTYRYDVPQEAAQVAESTSSVPLGWATCDNCGYMAPRQKFEQDDGRGNRFLQCPYCRQSNRITFAVE